MFFNKDNNNKQEKMDVTYESKEIIDDDDDDDTLQNYYELTTSPLIPESVEHINSITELSGTQSKAIPPVRPTILHLEAPKRPARHLRPPNIIGDDTSPQTSPGIVCLFFVFM